MFKMVNRPSNRFGSDLKPVKAQPSVSIALDSLQSVMTKTKREIFGHKGSHKEGTWKPEADAGFASQINISSAQAGFATQASYRGAMKPTLTGNDTAMLNIVSEEKLNALPAHIRERAGLKSIGMAPVPTEAVVRSKPADQSAPTTSKSTTNIIGQTESGRNKSVESPTTISNQEEVHKPKSKKRNAVSEASENIVDWGAVEDPWKVSATLCLIGTVESKYTTIQSSQRLRLIYTGY
jgi:hypothetical protein